jgi:hypothetical protein
VSRASRVVVVLGVAVLAAQLVRPAKTNPPVTSDVGAPPAVAALLRRACYDCHSHETRWPWYAGVAPTSWLLAHDVRDGRDELNFSTWDKYEAGARRKKLTKSVKEVREGEMPPWYYRAMHPEARLDDRDRAALETWIAEVSAASPTSDARP